MLTVGTEFATFHRQYSDGAELSVRLIDEPKGADSLPVSEQYEDFCNRKHVEYDKPR